ncbi:iron chelate uptake ABC transporter family permease subunit, partial [Paracoccus binzhouensis]|uniref:iron chelate uptake ABC transporter family permease subunit n=1 Tax=Paracoccus binzhouensis TaxID=2796149 RepID=UPI0018EF2529
VRAAVLVAAVLLSSAALTAVGPLMFLGVMAPQLAGALSPASGRARLLLAALTGGLLVTAADLLARNAGTDIGLPVGLVLVTLGAPVFVLALRMRLLLRTSSS